MEDIFEVISFFSSNWVVFLFLISIIAIFIGKIFYGISLFQPLEEIKYKQEEYRRRHKQEEFKKRMVKRHLKLGNSFLDVCQLKAAKTEFERALELNPTNVEAQMGLFKSEVFQPILERDYEDYIPEIAEKRLHLILEENPNDKHALLFLGNVYTPIDGKGALEYLNKALSQDSSLAVAYSQISYIYDTQNKFDDALIMIEKAASLSKWNTTIINNLGYHYIQKKDYEKAIAQFESLLRSDPRYLIPYWNLSNAYRMNGDFEHAYMWQNRLIELLEDKDVTSLERNQGVWFFYTESDKGAKFYDHPQKLCYSYYSMALTCHLIDLQEETQAFIKKAQEVKCDKTPVKSFLDFNITELQREQSSLINKLDEFKRILSPNSELCK